MDRMKTSKLGKILYGTLFVVVLPALLLLWAVAAKGAVSLPIVHQPAWGSLGIGAGLLLMSLGMLSLWRVGGGLPMNAFPPPFYVSSGVYRIFSHPIYLGFALVCFGISICAGSAAGVWLVSPTVSLASIALVLGYELPELKARFGPSLGVDRFLPRDDCSTPSARDRIRCYMTVLLPWLILYEGIVNLGIPADARVGYLSFEQKIPVQWWAELLYASVYLVVLFVPAVTRTRHDLRIFSIRGLVAMLIVFPLFLTVPLIAPARPSVTPGLLGNILAFDRVFDTSAAAFPSFHVIWAFLAAWAISGRRFWERFVWNVWAFAVAAACIIAGRHALVDVIAGVVVVVALTRIESVWSCLRSISEMIANSWIEWRIGPLRVINHGLYAGAGVFIGAWILDTLLQARHSVTVAIIAGGIIGAAIWAQFVEGSPAMLRPLGFYGGMLGSCAGGVIAALLSKTDIWLPLGALCVAGPWIQGVGRLRCLIQGCCHGRPTTAQIGIRYSHPRSRVVRLADLGGVPIHATPLYSILWNIVVALAATRLYVLHGRASMIGGVYLILSGLGRFVEEAYRGEPQTPIFCGLRFYQWIAFGTVIVGAYITTITQAPYTPQPVFGMSSAVVALICGVLAWFVSGADFPESNRRFSRLAEA